MAGRISPRRLPRRCAAIFPGKVFASAIPRNVRLSEAPSHGMPVCAYDKFSRGAAAYDAVAQEILAKEQ